MDMENKRTQQHDRVRESTPENLNQETDREILENIRRYGYNGQAEMDQRIQELNQEWDIERALEVNASTLALTGVLLGFLKNKRWFILPGIVSTFLLQHGLQGWCPPLPVLRKLGFRTRKEIEAEKHALKVLRGDFKRVSETASPEEILRVGRK